MRTRSTRNRNSGKSQQGNGRLFIQILLSIAIICGFMMFKDTSLPNGRTPRDYAEQILNTTVNLPEIIAEFKEESSMPAGAEVQKP